MEALAEPRQAWVKALNPATLYNAIKKIWHMGNAIAKSKAPPKPFIPQKDKG